MRSGRRLVRAVLCIPLVAAAIVPATALGDEDADSEANPVVEITVVIDEEPTVAEPASAPVNEDPTPAAAEESASEPPPAVPDDGSPDIEPADGAPNWTPPQEPPSMDPGDHGLDALGLTQPAPPPATLNMVGDDRVDAGDSGVESFRETIRAEGPVRLASGGNETFGSGDTQDYGPPDGGEGSSVLGAFFSAFCQVAVSTTATSPIDSIARDSCGRLDINGEAYDTDGPGANARPLTIVSRLEYEAVTGSGDTVPFILQVLRGDIGHMNLANGVSVTLKAQEDPEATVGPAMISGTPLYFMREPGIQNATLVVYQGLAPYSPSDGAVGDPDSGSDAVIIVPPGGSPTFPGGGAFPDSITYGTQSPLNVLPNSIFAHSVASLGLATFTAPLTYDPVESLVVTQGGVPGAPQDLGETMMPGDFFSSRAPRMMDLAGMVPTGNDISLTYTQSQGNLFTGYLTPVFGLDWVVNSPLVGAGIGACVVDGQDCEAKTGKAGDRVNLRLAAGNWGMTAAPDSEVVLTIPPGLLLENPPGYMENGKLVIPVGSLAASNITFLDLIGVFAAGFSGDMQILVQLRSANGDLSPLVSTTLSVLADSPVDAPDDTPVNPSPGGGGGGEAVPVSTAPAPVGGGDVAAAAPGTVAVVVPATLEGTEGSVAVPYVAASGSFWGTTLRWVLGSLFVLLLILGFLMLFTMLRRRNADDREDAAPERDDHDDEEDTAVSEAAATDT